MEEVGNLEIPSPQVGRDMDQGPRSLVRPCSLLCVISSICLVLLSSPFPATKLDLLLRMCLWQGSSESQRAENREAREGEEGQGGGPYWANGRHPTSGSPQDGLLNPALMLPKKARPQTLSYSAKNILQLQMTQRNDSMGMQWKRKPWNNFQNVHVSTDGVNVWHMRPSDTWPSETARHCEVRKQWQS